MWLALRSFLTTLTSTADGAAFGSGHGPVAASSCIACHVYASFGANGKPTAAAKAMLPYNATGKPIPAVLDGSLKFDFMWGVLLAPP